MSSLGTPDDSGPPIANRTGTRASNSPGLRIVTNACHSPARFKASVSKLNVDPSDRLGRPTTVPTSASRYLNSTSSVVCGVRDPCLGLTSNSRTFDPGRPGIARTFNPASAEEPATSTNDFPTITTCRAGSRSVRNPTTSSTAQASTTSTITNERSSLNPGADTPPNRRSLGRTQELLIPPRAKSGPTRASLTSRTTPYSVVHSREISSTSSQAP